MTFCLLALQLLARTRAVNLHQATTIVTTSVLGIAKARASEKSEINEHNVGQHLIFHAKTNTHKFYEALLSTSPRAFYLRPQFPAPQISMTD
jgi:hypothetical protein